MSLRKQIKKFFTSLEKTKKNEKLMVDRIDPQVLEAINDYAELLDRARKNVGISVKDVISSSLIMGFLLRSHLERYELEQCLKINAFENL